MYKGVSDVVNPVTAEARRSIVSRRWVYETIPIEKKETKLPDGFPAGREQLREEVRKEDVQTRLFE